MANVPLIATFADQTATQAAGAASQLVPPGAIMSYGGANAPTGWLLCDGAAVSRTVYANLFSAIGTSFGAGDGSTTFNLPDMRGRFVRYDDNMGNHGITGVTAAGAASRDTSRVHGSVQTQTTATNGLSGTAAGQTQGATTTALASGSAAGQTLGTTTPGISGTSISTNSPNIDHTHGVSNQSRSGDKNTPDAGFGTGWAEVGGGGSSGGMSANATHGHSGTVSGTTNIGHTHAASSVTGNTNITHTHAASALTISGDTETRPINIALNAIIKI